MARTLFTPSRPIIVLKAEVYGEKDPKTEKSITRLLRMSLSTSSSYSVIPWEVASALRLSPTESSKKIKVVTSSIVKMAPVVTLKKMIVLDKVVEDIEVICRDLPQSTCVDGIIGLNFIRNYKLFIDFQKGILELE